MALFCDKLPGFPCTNLQTFVACGLDLLAKGDCSCGVCRIYFLDGSEKQFWIWRKGSASGS